MALNIALQTRFSLGKLEVRWNWLIAACVIMTALGLGRLGVWQLDRAAEKVAAQQQLLLDQAANAIPIEEIPAGHLHRANPDLPNLHVALEGEYLNDKTILLLAEFFNSQIGYGVVTPLRLRSTGALVLVHRGWTTGILPPDTPPILRPVSGPVSIKGQIHVPAANARVIGSEIETGEWPIRMRSLEIGVIEDILGEPVFPFEVRLTADQPGVLARHWPAVAVDVNQHLFYSLQWFLFASAVVLIALFASSNLWQLLKGSDPAIADKATPSEPAD